MIARLVERRSATETQSLAASSVRTIRFFVHWQVKRWGGEESLAQMFGANEAFNQMPPENPILRLLEYLRPGTCSNTELPKLIKYTVRVVQGLRILTHLPDPGEVRNGDVVLKVKYVDDCV